MARKGVLSVLTALSSLVFMGRLIQLQIINPTYKALSENNSVVKRPVFPERGFIFDRNGKLLVANQPVYDLLAVPENTQPFDTLEMAAMLKTTARDLRTKIRSANRFSKKLPSIIVPQISSENHAAFQEKIWKYPGFYLQKKSIRDYRYSIAANILGYISEVNPSEIRKDNYYSQGELIGRQGIEKYYEKLLRGKKGMQYFQKDRFNRIIEPYKGGDYDVPVVNAEDIILTIDAELQFYGQSLLKNKRGGIVAIEPSTGEILALVTAPTYDPNILVGRDRSKNFKKLTLDTLAKPLFDRALQAQYAPGSPFKTLNALIALQENIITPNTKFRCDGGHYYAASAFMRCYCNVGSRNDLMRGIYQSCNTYFAKTYRKMIESYSSPEEGVNRWHEHLSSFGLGNYLGYDLAIGKPGFIPDASYYDHFYKKGQWKAPTIISNAIGQGEILTTPIQMANFTAAIANRGYYIKPHFLKRVKTEKTDSIYDRNYTTIDEKHFDTVIEGMYRTVENGTARIARIRGIEVCGKTGTVENFVKINSINTQLSDHSMFIAFAPKKNPQIVVSVFVENGYWGGRWAAPIASLVIEQYLTGTVKRKWLEKRMIEGSLLEEYKKPYSGKPFKINE